MSFVEKRNNLNELINMLTKAEKRSMIQISFRTQDPNIKTGTIRNPRQNSQLIHDSTVFLKSMNLLDLPQKSTVCTLFKAKSVDLKTYSLPSLWISLEPHNACLSWLTFGSCLSDFFAFWM